LKWSVTEFAARALRNQPQDVPITAHCGIIAAQEQAPNLFRRQSAGLSGQAFRDKMIDKLKQGHDLALSSTAMLNGGHPA
jgi:hypothetical protein